MGIFDKLFGKEKKTETNEPQISPTQDNNFVPIADTADLMNEDEFWNIIKATHDAANGNFDKQQNELEEVLKQLSLHNILLFDNRFSQLRGDAYDWQLWAAIYIIHGGCGDDSFTDFRDWVIAQGKEFYYRTLSNPETLVEVETDRIEIEWEGMGYVPMVVFDKLSGQEMPTGYRENMEIKGTDWDEDGDDLKNMFPKLYAKYSYNFEEE